MPMPAALARRKASAPQMSPTRSYLPKVQVLVTKKKPVLLGQYMWDFGGKKPMPGATMESQLAQTSRLLKAKAIHGVIFHCTPLVDMNLDAVNVSQQATAADTAVSGIDAVKVVMGIEGLDALCKLLGVAGKVGVVRAGGVGIVGKEGDIVAPVATDVVAGEVVALHVVLDFVDEMGGFVDVFGGQAANADRKGSFEGAGGVVGKVAVEVVAGVGGSFGVERGGGLVGDHGGLVRPEDVAVVVGAFAKEEQVARQGLRVVAIGTKTTKHLADGHGVLFA